MHTDSSKVTWEFVESTIPDIERAWGYADEIVREFDGLGDNEMELKLSVQIDADIVEELENAVDRAQLDVQVVFDEAYGRVWLVRTDVQRW